MGGEEEEEEASNIPDVFLTKKHRKRAAIVSFPFFVNDTCVTKLVFDSIVYIYTVHTSLNNCFVYALAACCSSARERSWLGSISKNFFPLLPPSPPSPSSSSTSRKTSGPTPPG